MEHEHGIKRSKYSSLDGSNIDKHSKSPLKDAYESEHEDLINKNESRPFEVNNASGTNGHPSNHFFSMEDRNNPPKVLDESSSYNYPKIRAVVSDDEAELCTSPTNIKPDVNEGTKSVTCPIEDTKLATPTTSLPAHDKDSPFVPKDVKSYNIPKTSSLVSETSDKHSSSSSLTFQVPDVVREQMDADISPKFSPPIQTMDKRGGYDPARIPSSVFEISNTTTPMEWSLCSNESLFSIQVGNASFSGDHMFMFGDLGKIGDLAKSDDLYILNSPPPAQVIGTEVRIPKKGKESAAEDIKDLTRKIDPIVNSKNKTSEPIKDAPIENTEDVNALKNMLSTPVNLKSSSMSHHSNGSGTSTHSFAFPILKDADKSGSLKSGKQRSQLLDVIVTSNFTWRKWFSCFSCKPCSCNYCRCGNCSCFSCC